MNTLGKQNPRSLKEFSSLQRHIFTSGCSFKGRRAAQTTVSSWTRSRQVLVFTRSKQVDKVKCMGAKGVAAG